MKGNLLYDDKIQYKNKPFFGLKANYKYNNIQLENAMAKESGFLGIMGEIQVPLNLYKGFFPRILTYNFPLNYELEFKTDKIFYNVGEKRLQIYYAFKELRIV